MGTIGPESYPAICKQAIGTLGRRGVYRWIERDELMGVGCLALVSAGVQDEALAVTVARRAMIDAIRRNEVRQRGRQYPSVRRDNSEDDDGNTSTPEDALERLFYARFIPAPERTGRLGNVMQELPERQYQAVMLTYWDGFSDIEVAQRLGVSRQAVDALLKRAQIKIREGVAIRESRAMNQVEGKIAGNLSRIIPAQSKGKQMLLTLQQVARRLGISEKTARKLAPQLPSVLIGKRYRYPEEGVLAFVNGSVPQGQRHGDSVNGIGNAAAPPSC